MTQVKKPFPENKHETRLVTEARPAGTAPSTYTEEPGKSIDMIEVVGAKPQVVRVSQAMYDGLVHDGTQFYAHDFDDLVFNAPPPPGSTYGAPQAIGRVVVPTGMAFDLVSLRFIITVPLASAAVYSPWYQVGDWETYDYYGYRVRVNDTLPWDSYEERIGAGVLDVRLRLNENYLDFGNDCPVHIVAMEGQTLTFEVVQFSLANPPAMLPGGVINIQVRGRWIPIQHYKRIVHANALE